VTVKDQLGVDPSVLERNGRAPRVSVTPVLTGLMKLRTSHFSSIFIFPYQVRKPIPV
jgi:hypothetical protein